jgi:hypothetical protein
MVISQFIHMEPDLVKHRHFMLFIRVLATVGLQNWVKYVHEQAAIPPQRIKGFNSEGKLTATSLSGLFNLYTNIECRDGKLGSCFLVLLYMKFNDLNVDDELLAVSLLQLLDGIECCASNYDSSVFNGNEYFCPNPVSLGAALPITTTLLNHSCNPNICMYFSGNTGFVMRAWVPIKKGEQIMITYASTFTIMAKEQRQALIFANQKFICNCEACDNNWPLMGDLPMDSKLFQELQIQEERELQRKRIKGNLDNFKLYVSSKMDLETKRNFVTKLYKKNKCLTQIYEMQKAFLLTLFVIEGNFSHVK